MKAKGGELSGIAKSGARTIKWPPQHLMWMDMVRTRTRSHWPILFELNSYVEPTLKDFLMDPTGGPGRSTLVYKQLIATEADETLQLTSTTDGSSTSFCLQLNRLLAELLDSCAKDMIYSPGVLRLRSKKRKKLLKEFYRVVKEATNLVRLCCNQESWLMTAFCMVDSRQTYALRFLELLWFKRVVGSSEIGQELDWKLRWETALVEDSSQLQENVRKVAQDTSTKEFHLAGNLSRRLEDTQGTTDHVAQNHVVYLNLEGLNVHDDKPLGKGATAVVYKATWWGEVFAVKKFRGNISKLAAKEVYIATKVHHPNIVPMLGCLQVHEGTDGVLMELMSSSLLSYVQARKSTRVCWFKRTPFQPLVVVDMILQIAEAMRYLHENNIAHLDLKAENILVNLICDSYLAQEGYANLKLVDFGCSRINVKSSTSLYESYVGTTLYRAPEIRTGKYTRSVDIYGFALVSYQVMTGNEPFPKPKSFIEFNEKVRNGDRPNWRLIDPYPSSLKTLIEECWSGDPFKRPAFASICKRLRRIKGFLITGSYDGVEELPTHEESMDPASQRGVQQDMQGPDSYFVLSQTAAQRIFHLKSGWDGHRSSGTDVSSLLETPHLNKMQCNLLVECLQSSMDKVKEQMSSNPESVSAMTLTEFYRIVIGCEKLILQCCDLNWQTAAIWVMDCKSTFLLWISELLWCSAIIANPTWQDVAFTERIDEISRKLSHYAEKDHSQLKDMLLEVSTVVDSRYVSGDLVTYLSQRADAICGEVVVECAPHLSSMDMIGYNIRKAIMFNESVAIKVLDSEFRDWSKSEVSVIAKLNHPGVVPLVGVTSHPDNGRPCLIMELMSGNLSELIAIRSRFSLHVSVDIMLQIGEAMQHIHNAGLVHRDLKPINILFKVVEDEQLSSAGFVVVKVAGFARATESKEGELSENLKYVGNPRYKAPEAHREEFKIGTVRMRNSNVLDVYSFGLVCYEILSGQSPFEDCRTFRQMGERVRDGVRPTLPGTCPPILAYLIQRCWASDPNSRPNFERICLELRHIKTMLITGRLSSINFQ